MPRDIIKEVSLALVAYNECAGTKLFFGTRMTRREEGALDNVRIFLYFTLKCIYDDKL